VLPGTASNNAVDLRLVKDTNPVLEYRLMCVLNKALESVSKDDKGGLGDRVGCVCQRRDVSHVQAVEIARPPSHLKPWRYFSFRDLAAVDLRSGDLLIVPRHKLLVDGGSVDVAMPFRFTVH
jgi:hypothetical protein